MSNRNKKTLFGILNGVLFVFGLYLWNKLSLNIIAFYVILFGSPLFSWLVVTLIPTKKKSSSKKRQQTLKKKTSSISNWSKKGHNLLRSENEILTSPLEQLTWREFERLCFLYYKSKGYKPRETREGADGGIDLIIYNRYHQTEVAIQIKHYIESGKQVTVKEIRELDSSKKNYNCILAEFISSTGYTNAALIEADKRKIKCHTIEKILEWKVKEMKNRQLA